MPCRSDYLEPSTREKALKHTAGLLLYVLRRIGVLPTTKLMSDALDIYCKTDYVPDLCAVLTGLPDAERDELMSHKADPLRGPQLALWWHEHQEADAKRKIAEAEEKVNDLKRHLQEVREQYEAALQELRTLRGEA